MGNTSKGREWREKEEQRKVKEKRRKQGRGQKGEKGKTVEKKRGEPTPPINISGYATGDHPV